MRYYQSILSNRVRVTKSPNLKRVCSPSWKHCSSNVATHETSPIIDHPLGRYIYRGVRRLFDWSYTLTYPTWTPTRTRTQPGDRLHRAPPDPDRPTPEALAPRLRSLPIIPSMPIYASRFCPWVGRTVGRCWRRNNGKKRKKTKSVGVLRTFLWRCVPVVAAKLSIRESSWNYDVIIESLCAPVIFFDAECGPMRQARERTVGSILLHQPSEIPQHHQRSLS